MAMDATALQLATASSQKTDESLFIGLGAAASSWPSPRQPACYATNCLTKGTCIFLVVLELSRSWTQMRTSGGEGLGRQPCTASRDSNLRKPQQTLCHSMCANAQTPHQGLAAVMTDTLTCSCQQVRASPENWRCWKNAGDVRSPGCIAGLATTHLVMLYQGLLQKRIRPAHTADEAASMCP